MRRDGTKGRSYAPATRGWPSSGGEAQSAVTWCTGREPGRSGRSRSRSSSRRRGFDVVATMRDPADGAGLAEEAGAGARSASNASTSTTRRRSHCPAGLRVLVNNAGVESDNLPLEVMPADVVARDLRDERLRAGRGRRSHAIPLHARRGRGRDLQRHVVVDARAGSVPRRVPVAKAAVTAIGESLAAEVAQFGIRVLEIMPGPIETDMLAHLRPAGRRDRARAVPPPRPNGCGRAARTSATMYTPRRRCRRAASSTRSSTTTPRCAYGCDDLSEGMLEGLAQRRIRRGVAPPDARRLRRAMIRPGADPEARLPTRRRTGARGPEVEAA